MDSCPYCSSENVEELEPYWDETVDGTVMIIRYCCGDCGEPFEMTVAPNDMEDWD